MGNSFPKYDGLRAMREAQFAGQKPAKPPARKAAPAPKKAKRKGKR